MDHAWTVWQGAFAAALAAGWLSLHHVVHPGREFCQAVADGSEGRMNFQSFSGPVLYMHVCLSMESAELADLRAPFEDAVHVRRQIP